MHNCAALYPIDTIKTRLQTMRSGGGFRALVQSGGSKALYAGLLGNLAGVAPSTAIFMAFYEPVKQAVQKRVPEDRSFLGPLVAGSGAGLAASTIRVPTEVVKQRIQAGVTSHLDRTFYTLLLLINGTSAKPSFNLPRQPTSRL